MKKIYFVLVVLAFCAVPGLVGHGWAAEHPVNTGKDGVAVKGYDTVAYFTVGRPVKGDPDISFEWHGAVWRFSSEQNRELFKSDPEKYAPQYGGY